MKRSPYDLEQFIVAQEPVIDQVMMELNEGRKRSHWMWFIFPQLEGLGHSNFALRFGIASLDEARAYLAHPLLGPRLEQCTRAVIQHRTVPLRTIFGPPDDLKFHSCMTLFAKAADTESKPFEGALSLFWDGASDPKTLSLLARPC